MICCNTDPVSLCSLCSKYPLVFCRFKMKTPVQEQLLDLLDDLGEEELKLFHWYLQNVPVGDFPTMKKSHLEKASRRRTVDLMVATYTDNVMEVARLILEMTKEGQYKKKTPGPVYRHNCLSYFTKCLSEQFQFDFIFLNLFFLHSWYLWTKEKHFQGFFLFPGVKSFKFLLLKWQNDLKCNWTGYCSASAASATHRYSVDCLRRHLKDQHRVTYCELPD